MCSNLFVVISKVEVDSKKWFDGDRILWIYKLEWIWVFGFYRVGFNVLFIFEVGVVNWLEVVDDLVLVVRGIVYLLLKLGLMDVVEEVFFFFFFISMIVEEVVDFVLEVWNLEFSVVFGF